MTGEAGEPNFKPTGFDAHCGFSLDHADGDEVRARVVIADHHLQPLGLVHGGVYAALAESMASIATAHGAGLEKFVAGMSNHTSFLRPVFAGDTVTAVGVPKHRGRSTWVWEIDMADAQGRSCALVRVTIAIRERE